MPEKRRRRQVTGVAPASVPPVANELPESDEVDLYDLTKTELKDLAYEEGLSISGTKQDLIDRLEE